MTEITRELLDKFWMGLCTEEEAAAVESYFKQNPGDNALFDEFEGAGAEPIDSEDREEMLAKVIKAVGASGGKFARVAGVWRWSAYAAAACLILLAGAGWWMNHAAVRRSDSPLPMLEAATWMGKHNADTKKLRIQLPDSTETILSPGATILYRKDFGHYDKREVKVEGKVLFSVYKDKQKPFIVYSDGVQTTVLGTILEVTNEKNSDQILVKLLQGKVMVMADEKTDSVKRYILTPGEELVYGKRDRTVAVRGSNDHHGDYAVHRVRHLPGRADSLVNWYMFNNQGLADVFDQIAILYNVDIQYSSADLHNKYFIGKLEKKDSLNKIMRDIALLNHLSVIERQGCFIIRKR